MRVVVIGNGTTAVDKQGVSHVNQHTTRFLFDMAESGFDLSFIQPMELLRENANLHDFALSIETVESLTIDRMRLLALLRTLPPALWCILRADFVYIFYPGTLPRAVARLCTAIGKPFGLYLRGEQFSTEGSGGEVFRRARFINTVSSSLAQSIVPLNNHIFPIRPMLDLSIEDTMQRDFFSRPERPWILLFVGRLEAAKGVPELIKAAEILYARGFPFSLLLIGGGPLYDDLATHYGNEPDKPIQVLGPIMDKSSLMAKYEASDFFILPTHHEGFPRVLYEAMIKSMVVFTTFVGGIPGLMKDGENCVKIPLRSPGSIADTIESTSRDVVNMQRISESGLKTISTVLNTYPTHLEAVKEQLNV